MSKYVWIVEHREYCSGEMVCTIIHVASTLQIAEHLMRFGGPGPVDNRGYVAIYPQVVDEAGLGVPEPAVMADKGHYILNFYDLLGNQLWYQPVMSSGLCPAYSPTP